MVVKVWADTKTNKKEKKNEVMALLIDIWPSSEDCTVYIS